MHLITGGGGGDVRKNFRFLVWQKSYQAAISGPFRWLICSLTNFGLLLSIWACLLKCPSPQIKLSEVFHILIFNLVHDDDSVWDLQNTVNKVDFKKNEKCIRMSTGQFIIKTSRCDRNNNYVCILDCCK